MDEAEAILKYRVMRMRTICEVLREIYDIVVSLPEPDRSTITQKLIEATEMAKKMDNRLKEYQQNYTTDMEYKNNDDWRQDISVRHARRKQ